jgi:hypothetical protein
MRVLRNTRIKGVTLRDRIMSDDIRAECNVIDVARWVEHEGETGETM